MARDRALSTTTTLTSAVGLLLVACGVLGVLEHPVAQPPALAWWTPDLPVPQPGSADDAGSTPTSDPARRPDQGPVPCPTPPPPAADPSDPSAGAPDAVPMAPPLQLAIAQLGVTAPVVPVGVLDGGGMEVPDDVGTVGWYSVPWRSVSPGDTGVAVLAGHRDSRRDGAGALHQLARLVPGDTITVLHADATTSIWVVDEVTSTPRTQLPAERLFTRTGAPQLAVVTCGGPFDLLTRSYTKNTIVYASRVGPGAAAVNGATAGAAATVS